ncbi:hypothetical protein B0H14DRAFT_2169167, partial [Mycena olivaceomarginata]
YHCAQNEARQHKSKKIDDTDKHRDKCKMTTFKCGGYLYITVDDDSSDVRVRLKHSDNHVAYHNHDVPQKVKNHITANRDLTTTQV